MDKNLEIADKRLQKDREAKDRKPPETTLEAALDGKTSNRQDTETKQPALIEKKLEDKKVTGNAALQGLPERRLDTASTTPYPHRNPEAWERTGDKRPINNLAEERGEASDEKRIARYEKADKKAQDQPDRILDKDVGKQKSLKTFNLRRSINEKKYGAMAEYLAYKSGASRVYSGKFEKVKRIDQELTAIMSARKPLSEDETKKVAALKNEKMELLGLEKTALGTAAIEGLNHLLEEIGRLIESPDRKDVDKAKLMLSLAMKEIKRMNVPPAEARTVERLASSIRVLEKKIGEKK